MRQAAVLAVFLLIAAFGADSIGQEAAEEHEVLYLSKDKLSALKEKLQHGGGLTAESVEEVLAHIHVQNDELMVPMELRGTGLALDNLGAGLKKLGPDEFATRLVNLADSYAENKDGKATDRRAQPMSLLELMDGDEDEEERGGEEGEEGRGEDEEESEHGADKDDQDRHEEHEHDEEREDKHVGQVERHENGEEPEENQETDAEEETDEQEDVIHVPQGALDSLKEHLRNPKTEIPKSSLLALVDDSKLTERDSMTAVAIEYLGTDFQAGVAGTDETQRMEHMISKLGAKGAARVFVDAAARTKVDGSED